MSASLYLLGPLLALAVVGGLAAVLRLTFGRESDRDDLWGAPEDFGLLTPVATVDSGAEAAAIRDRLIGAGIRATTTVARDGRRHVLVFQTELDRARRLVG